MTHEGGRTAYAHSLPNRPEDEWDTLEAHLQETAELASRFAAAFDSAEWGRLAGLWHDLGKYKPEFQGRLRGERLQTEHAGVGAALASKLESIGIPLAFAIAGHHAGLANHSAQGDTKQRSLRERLAENAPELDRLREFIPRRLMDAASPQRFPFPVPASSATRTEQDRFKSRLEFFTRFLFSTLVDADFLATEEFFTPGKRVAARSFDSIPELRRRLDRWLDRFRPDSVDGQCRPLALSNVNRLRADVLERCRAAADLPTGLFSLTVPTGGGKTLSSMAFALRHAERHDLRRAIVAIPYTSIIEQNARVYAECLGARNVIEHHSNVDEAMPSETGREAELRRRLAAENWDAPVVVTTNVQLFESLFANAPSRCRKLHNIARSVLILDEAQSIPPGYLACVLDILQELVDTYGCSLLLMSATQPSLRRRAALPWGFPPEAVREIVPDPEALASQLKRVAIRWLKVDEPTPYEEVAQNLTEHEQVLAVVHTRRDARTLAMLLPESHRYHLSALMCAAHRTERLAEVRDRLLHGLPCRLVATQLVEAGVDLDFPVVYRTMAGLDSLAQAAGRCNRGGGLCDPNGIAQLGQFVIYRAATEPPPGLLLKGLETTRAMLERHGTLIDFTSPECMDEFFRALYMKCDLDKQSVQAERRQRNFATVAQRVRLIEDGYMRPVVVPWGDAPHRVRAFERSPSRQTQRALQRFLVQIPDFELRKLKSLGAVVELHESTHVLAPAFGHMYDPVLGLVVDREPSADPMAYIA